MESVQISWLLRLMPQALLARLDAWSYREAMRRAEKRRQAWLKRHPPQSVGASQSLAG